MSPDQADPEQHKQRASLQFGSPRPQGVGNGTTDVETGSDLHSTGRKTIHFVILTTTNSYCKKTEVTRTKPNLCPQPPPPQGTFNMLAPSTKHSQKPEINQNKKQAFTW